mgnify:CR=1 FL=1
MASGLPIVSTRVGGIPEVLDTRGAELIPPANPEALAKAINKLMVNKKKIAFAHKQFPHIIQQHFSEESMLSKTAALYCQQILVNDRQTTND